MTPDARAQLYAFFSRLWVKEVDPAFRATLLGPLGQAVLPDVDLSAELDADFAHLTIVNLAPYESFFRRDDGQVEAGAVNPVVEFMKKYGFEADLGAARALAPDHLGIELELMAVLCSKEHEALAVGNAPYAGVVRGVQREFLVKHLLAWCPMFFFAARRTARTDFYRQAAEATLQFLCGDLEALS